MADVTISTIQDLVAFSSGTYGRGTSSAYLDVELAADVDFADLTEYGAAYNWAGCTGTWYVNFNGNGHKIDNIAYTGTSTWGFFENIDGSVRNLKLTNMNVTSSANVMGIATNCGACIIQNCHITGFLTSLNNYAIVFAAHDRDGRFEVRECSFSGTARGSAYACACTGSKANAWAINNIITGTFDAFGSNGEAYLMCMTNCNAVNCEFNGVVKAGGSANFHYNWNSAIYNCIFIPQAGSRTTDTGGGTVVNCYYDSDKATAAGITCNATAATTAELKSGEWGRAHGLPS
jgi:hypothetical protein